MKNIYLLLIAVLLLASCKKDKDNTPTTNPADAELKSVSQSPSGITTTYSYDGQGRLVTLHNSTGSGMNITYSGDTVTEAWLNDSGMVYAFHTLFLNTSGIAINSLLSDTDGAVLAYFTYLYDTANFRIDEKAYDPSNNLVGHKVWGILANNVYSYSSSDSISMVNTEIGYQYTYDTKTSIGNYNMGLKYNGPSSQNPETIMHKTGTTGNVRYTFQYTFDNSGRISSKAAYNHLNELVYTNTYSYN